jgi:rRNA maturation protein Nop10
MDTCGVCGEQAMVSEPRDFGHLKDGWQKEKRK